MQGTKQAVANAYHHEVLFGGFWKLITSKRRCCAFLTTFDSCFFAKFCLGNNRNISEISDDEFDDYVLDNELAEDDVLARLHQLNDEMDSS